MKYLSGALPLLLLLISSRASATKLPGAWEVQSNKPLKRSVAAAACDEKYMYLFGGRDGDAHTLNDIWRFDPANTDEPWSQIFPGGDEPERQDAGLALVGDSVPYLVGGVDAKGEIQLTMMRMDTADFIWEVVPDKLLRPTPRSQQAMVGGMDHGFYMLFGLAAGKFLNDVWYYSYTSDAWTVLSEINYNKTQIGATHPEARLSSCCDMNDEETAIVCFGGAGLEGDFDDAWMFTIASRTWTELRNATAKRPGPRYGALCGFKRGQFLVSAGADIDGNLYDETMLLTISTRTWADGPKPPFQRQDTQGCLIGDTFYTTSGMDADEIPYNDVWKLKWDEFIWRRIVEDEDIPPPRSAAAGARVGDQLYMMWGLGSNIQTFDEIWVYHFVNRKWALLDNDRWVGVSKDRPRRGLVGATAIERGTMIWTFGGYYTNAAGEMTLVNELLSFDVSNDANELEELLTEGAKPPARERAASVRVDEDFVVYGGYNQDEDEFTDWWAYRPQRGAWMQLKVSGAQQPKYGKAGAFMHLLPNGTILLMGGSRFGDERWGINIDKVTNAEQWTANYFAMVSSTPTGYTNAHIRRSEAGCIGVGWLVACCGGANTDEYAAYPEGIECFTYNAATGKNEPFAAPQMGEEQNGGPGRPMMNPLPAHWANRLMWFHGSVLTDGIVRDDVCSNQQQEYVIPSSFLCEPGATDGDNCMHCSRGHYKSGGVCVPVTPGHFIEAFGSLPQPCDAGEFTFENASISAQACLPCEEDSFANKSGSVQCTACPTGYHCPIRASMPLPKDADTEAIGGASQHDAQPLSYAKGEVPIVAYIVFGSVAGFIVGCIIISLIIHHLVRRKRLAHYVTEEDQRRLIEMYRTYDPFNAGVDANVLVLLLVDLGYDCNPAEAREIMNTFDSTGTLRLFYDDFSQAVCHLIATEVLEPLPGSKAANQGISKLTEKLGAIPLKKFDFLFSKKHSLTDIGESQMRTKNTIGGIMSIVFGLGGAGLFTLLILSFVYSNIFEVRSTIPRVVVERKLTADFEVTIETNGDTNWQNCVANYSTRAVFGSCANSNFSLSGFTVGRQTVGCIFEDPRSCKTIWKCTECGIAEVEGRIELTMLDPDWFSDETRVDIRVRSGVEGEASVASYVLYADDDYVFKGLPATVVYAEVTSTVFSSPYSVWDQRTEFQTGYHVRGLTQKSVVGNQIDYTEFPHVFTVPVTVSFAELETTLLVTRVASQTVVQLCAAVLGAVSGWLGICGFIVGCFDWLQMKLIQRNISKMDALKRTYSRFAQVQKITDGYLKGMVQAQMSHKAAEATFDMVKAVIRDTNNGDLDALFDEDDLTPMKKREPLATIGGVDPLGGGPQLGGPKHNNFVSSVQNIDVCGHEDTRSAGSSNTGGGGARGGRRGSQLSANAAPAPLLRKKGSSVRNAHGTDVPELITGGSEGAITPTNAAAQKYNATQATSAESVLTTTTADNEPKTTTQAAGQHQQGAFDEGAAQQQQTPPPASSSTNEVEMQPNATSSTPPPPTQQA